jgi:hypothetical protein
MWMRNYWWQGNWGYSSGWIHWMLPFVILDVVLKALALWRSARNGQKWWFFFLLIINSLGILPGIYLLTHQEEISTSTGKSTKPAKRSSRKR